MDVLILGLDHWIQRHQDNVAERSLVRQSFARGIRRLIEERRVQVVAEEAGNDDEVAEALQRDENTWAALEGRGPRRIEPIETIARTVTRALDGCHYTDIRPPGNWPDSRTPEYELAMLNAILLNTVNAESVLVLCGEFHRGNISRALAGNGRIVEDRDFNWVREM